jgi:uncharacterized protein (DUF1684 family)
VVVRTGAELRVAESDVSGGVELPPMPDAEALLQLADWRRRVAELYATVRHMEDAVAAWNHWRQIREELMLTHPQSPLPFDERHPDRAPRYYDYDPAWRVHADVSGAEGDVTPLPLSAPGEVNAAKIATARFTVGGVPTSLAVFWLREYSGGLFVSFRDATSGSETYGAGRYVLDTAKGADLGVDDGRLVLDFNFSYQPSCSYDPKWSCPLPTRENWLDIAIRAGERLPAPPEH